MMSVPKQGPVVAIDGPAGTGKSSVTKRLADELGFVHVDTGALYRSVALLCLERKIDYGNDPEQAVEAARQAHLEFRRDSEKNPSNRVLLNGEDVTTRIRTPEVSMAASSISAIPGVRAALLGLQRRLGCEGRTILEGRDIGTVVFPDADVKFFMTASVEERAKRRLAQMEATGEDTPSFEEVKNDIARRDDQDSGRETAPLKKAEDAIEVDTTALTLDQVVGKMKAVVGKRVQGE